MAANYFEMQIYFNANFIHLYEINRLIQIIAPFLNGSMMASWPDQSSGYLLSSNHNIFTFS
jgi:hypothetical protein